MSLARNIKLIEIEIVQPPHRSLLSTTSCVFGSHRVIFRLVRAEDSKTLIILVLNAEGHFSSYFGCST